MPLDMPCRSGIHAAQHCTLLLVVLVGCRNGHLSSLPKSLPCMHYLKLPVPTISSNPQLGLHDSGMSSSLAAAVKEANLLAGSSGFGSRLKEGASLAGQVAAAAHAAAPSPHLFSAFPLLCTIAPRHAASSPSLHAAHTYFPHFRNSTLCQR